MGKDQVLDAPDHALKMNRLLFLSFLAFWSIFVLTACSLPRIIILKDPLTPEEHLNLGVAYERREEFDQAIREYQLAAKKLPIAFLYLGNAYFLRNDWDQAEICYKKAIKKDAKNAAAHNNLAWLYYQKGKNLEEAEALAQKAIELDPSQSSIYRDTLEKVREKKRAAQP
jgi:tetratricopeptide (TPR) repeat protein